MTNVSISPLSRIENSVRYLFLLALFSVAFSTALTNLFVGLTYIGFLLALCTSAPLRRVLRSPPGLLALALLAMFIVGATWSIAPRGDILSALRKYSRLLILPIGVSLSWRDPTLPRHGLYWFLGGTVVLAVSCYLVSIGLMPTSDLGWWRVGDAKDAFVFRNHITIGILLSFAACISFLLATYGTTMRARMAALGGGLFFTVPIIFLSQGRTGYVALFIGVTALFVLRTRITPLRTLGGLGAIVLVFFGFYATSANFQSRTNDLINEVQTGQQHSPNGLRMSFMRVGMQVVAAHPLFGLGTGSFAQAYAPTAERTWPPGSPMAVARHQPHSEFLLVTVQLGLLGAVIYFAMLGTLGSAALRQRNFEADSLALLWVIYVVSSAYNSLLWDTTEAHWFLLLSGCLYVGALRRRAVQP